MEIVFYRNKEKPNYYLLYKGKNGVNVEKMLCKLTNMGEFENSGFEKVEIELAHVLKVDLNGEFFQFLVDNVSTNYIEHPFYNDETFKAWYEFKKYEPEKWFKEFETFQDARISEQRKNNPHGLQTTLF